MIFIFIIPQNYDFKNKFLGFLDYSTLILLTIIYVLTFLVLHILNLSFYSKILVFIIVNVPITLICIIGYNHENIIYVFYYIIKFYKNKTIYFYRKNFFDF